MYPGAGESSIGITRIAFLTRNRTQAGVGGSKLSDPGRQVGLLPLGTWGDALLSVESVLETYPGVFLRDFCPSLVQLGSSTCTQCT